MKASGNTILLTGGTSGIGYELLTQFYKRNNTVIVTSSNISNLEKLKRNFPAIEAIVCDLADLASVQQLITTCLNKFTNINMIINNAGIQLNYSWLEEKNGYRKISEEITVNFTSPMYLLYGLLPLMANKPDAAIINVSSGLVYAPKKSAPIYCATKAAIHQVTKAIRYQLQGTTIKVFEIIPSLVSTSMTEGRGRGKITPTQLVNEFMRNFQNDVLESNIGKTKLLKIIQRISPSLTDRIMMNGL